MRKPLWLRSFAAVVRYEFLMQVRRPALWIIVLIAGILSGFPFTTELPAFIPPLQMAGGATHFLNIFLPIVFGILLADRLPRDRRLNTVELLDSMPTSSGPRLWGKYVGASLATALPLGLVYFGLAAILAVQRQDVMIVVLEFPAFVLLVVPALIFVGAFAIVCTQVLPVPLFSVLFIGYWFWGNVVSPERIPTITCTPLTPIGGYAAHGVLGLNGGVCDTLMPPITPAQGWMSIALLLGVALLVMFTAQFVMCRHAER